MQGIFLGKKAMPTSTDANVLERNRPASRRNRKDSKAGVDPADPRHENKPLAEIADMLEEPGSADTRRLDEIIEHTPKASQSEHAPFWDARSAVAFSISFAIGSIAGVPIGLYLYERWF